MRRYNHKKYNILVHVLIVVFISIIFPNRKNVFAFVRMCIYVNSHLIFM